ncbi:MAG: aspartyl-phosphate phosphatase Spo0E family protein [Eubacteriales bacterium]|nr:aspartyl-phosphate phosphatase Spo0E family protein [Eubacteriales bacterium]
MGKLETLKQQIESERRALNEMLEGKSLEEALDQSRRLDKLIEEYVRMTS